MPKATDPAAVRQDGETVNTRARAALKEVLAAVGVLREQLAAAKSRRDALQAELSALYEQTLAGPDVLQFIGEVIDFRAGVYEANLVDADLMNGLTYPRGARYSGLITKRALPLNFEDVEHAMGRPRRDGKQRGDQLEAHRLTIFPMDQGLFQYWPYFLFGDLMKERLGEVLAHQQPKFSCEDDAKAVGPSLTERRKTIDRIAGELHSVNTEIGRITGEIDQLSAPVMASARFLPATSQL